MFANKRIARAKIFATKPTSSTGTRSGASTSGPGQKWAMNCFPPSRSPFTTTMIRVTTASVAVTQMLPVAAPPNPWCASG